MASDNELLIRIRTILEGQGIKLTAEELKNLAAQAAAASRGFEKVGMASRTAGAAAGSLSGKLENLTDFIKRRALSAFTGLTVAILGVGSVIRAVANQPELVQFRNAFASAADSLGAFIVRTGPVKGAIGLLTSAFRSFSEILLAINPSLAPQATAFGQIAIKAGDAAKAVNSLTEAEKKLRDQADTADQSLNDQLETLRETGHQQLAENTARKEQALARADNISDPVKKERARAAINTAFGASRASISAASADAQASAIDAAIAASYAREDAIRRGVPDLAGLQVREGHFKQASAHALQSREAGRAFTERRVKTAAEIADLERETAGQPKFVFGADDEQAGQELNDRARRLAFLKEQQARDAHEIAANALDQDRFEAEAKSVLATLPFDPRTDTAEGYLGRRKTSADEGVGRERTDRERLSREGGKIRRTSSGASTVSGIEAGTARIEDTQSIIAALQARNAEKDRELAEKKRQLDELIGGLASGRQVEGENTRALVSEIRNIHAQQVSIRAEIARMQQQFSNTQR